MIIIILSVLVVLLVFLIPVAHSIGIISFIPYYLDDTFAATPTYVLRQLIAGQDSMTLLAIPMFSFSGIIMAKGGISEKLFNLFAYFLGNKTAGIPMVVVLTTFFYGMISGSAMATCATVAAMTIPIMTKLKYDISFCAALVAVSGGIATIVPPSVPSILYSLGSGASIADLFIAGFIPGALVAISLMSYTYFYCKKNGEQKELLLENYNKLHEIGFLTLLKQSFWALLSPIIILGGIYGGFFTPSEASVISVAYAFFICIFVYKSIKISEIFGTFCSAVKSFTSILFILCTAQAFSRILILIGTPQQLATMLSETFTSPVTLLIAINVFLLLVGMVMDTGPAILILTPILTPIVAEMGIDLVHFGIIMVTNLGLGYVTPPLAILLFAMNAETKVPIMTIAKKGLPMMLSYGVALILITAVPAFSLILT